MTSLSVFLDASVILSGLASSSGGSAKVIAAAKKKKVRLVTSVLVVEEVTKHLEKLNIKPSDLEILISTRVLGIIKTPPEETIDKFRKLTHDQNDAHVIAAGVTSGADVLLSLDKKHILTTQIKLFLKPIKVMSPKEFWKWVDQKFKLGFLEGKASFKIHKGFKMTDKEFLKS